MTTPYLKIQNIEKLRALQLSIELVKKVGKIIQSLPFEEGHIKDQLKRASTSIIQSISKGEQIYVKNKFNHYSVAIGSAQETKSWLMTCMGKGLIPEGEFLTLESMIDSIIKMLNRILENLKNTYTDVDLPSAMVQNAKTLPCFQLAQDLVKELHEIDHVNLGEWYSYIKDQLVIASSNIASHVSESEQIYPKKKFLSLNYSFQECNVVKTYLELIKEDIVEKEKYEELKEMIAEIQHLIYRELNQINPDIKGFI